MNIRIGSLWVHRLEQWDLGCTPLICIHWRYDHGNGSRRIFCLWTRGIQVGGGKRWVVRLSTTAVQIGRHTHRWRADT